MKNVIKLLFFLLGAIFSLALVSLLVWSVIDRTNGRISSSDENRKYLLYIPASYDPNMAIPLVINIHGFAQWPANQAEVSQWNKLADEKGFIVVYPSGTGFPKRWQVAQDTENPGAVDQEVQFFVDLIDKLSTEYAIDPTRIYASGLSNGAGMALRLACDIPERIAAIGGVAGAYLVDLKKCSGGVPGIFFHGLADEIVPFEGGPSERFSWPFPNIAQFVEDYAQINGCDLNESIIFNTENIKGVKYESCRQSANVVFYTIADGGHTWPGGKALPAWITGKTSEEIDATRLMWEFFNEQASDN